MDQIGLVETIHRKFLQSLVRRLGDSLETAVTADLAGIEQIPFSDFLNSIDAGGCLIPLNAAPSGGRAVLELSPGFVRRVLGILIGAPDNTPRPERLVTPIERHILSECFDNITLDLREAWASHRVKFEPEPMVQGGEQVQPAMEGIAIVVNSVLSLDGSTESIRLALPALLVRLAIKDSSAKVVPAQAAGRQLVLEAMHTASVCVEAVLSGPTLRMQDLLSLEPGRVLALGPPANCSVECVINGVAKFRGELIANGRNQALQIGSPIEIRTNPRD